MDYSTLSKRDQKKLRNQMRRTTTSSLPQINRPILDEVAIVRTDDSDSISRFTLGHQYYRDDICTVKTMDLSYLRKVFEGYKNMTRCVDERVYVRHWFRWYVLLGTRLDRIKPLENNKEVK